MSVYELDQVPIFKTKTKTSDEEPGSTESGGQQRHDDTEHVLDRVVLALLDAALEGVHLLVDLDLELVRLIPNALELVPGERAENERRNE